MIYGVWRLTEPFPCGDCGDEAVYGHNGLVLCVPCASRRAAEQGLVLVEVNDHA